MGLQEGNTSGICHFADLSYVQNERVTMSCTICAHTHTHRRARQTHTYVTPHTCACDPYASPTKYAPHTHNSAKLRVWSTQKDLIYSKRFPCQLLLLSIYLDLFSSFDPDCDDDYDDCTRTYGTSLKSFVGKKITAVHWTKIPCKQSARKAIFLQNLFLC